MKKYFLRLLWIFVFLFICGGGLMAGEIVQVPKVWKIQPALNSSSVPDSNAWKNAANPSKDVNSFWYQQSVNIPAGWDGKRVFLDFNRIEGDAIVFVNNKKVGELLRPGGEMEISSQVKAGGENIIRVFITRDYTDISRGFEQDRIRYVCLNHMTGKVPMEKWRVGITGDVNLISRPKPAGIASAIVKTSWRNKELAFDVTMDASENVEGLSLAADISDEKGVNVLSWTGPAINSQAGRSAVNISRKWENPHLWELDAGYLYTAQIKLMKDKTVLDAVQPFKFGFREIWLDGRKIMMNGHEAHWRLALMHNLTFGDSSPKGMAFARLLGYNAGYIQAHPELWWRGCSWANETPLFSQELLDACDQVGFAMMLPAPSVAFLGTSVFTDPVVKKDYEREMDLHMRHYRNHPSVLSWTLSMNSVGFSKEAINPQNMGQREEKRIGSGQAKAVITACEIAKAHDPTRLAYSHADGNIGDIASTCFYLNFAPLQEREEWTQEWARSANMPYMMAECGQPYTANFWKGKRFLPTEYFAIYFGDSAYAAETEAGLAKLVEYGLANKGGHGAGGTVKWSDYPVYWDFQKLFVRNTNRAWRISGINGGWQYWNLDVGYGKPAKTSFESLPLVTSRPAWANPNFDIESQANHPLLVCIAGSPSNTDKTHTFYSGEKVTKNVAIVWDGAGKTAVESAWTLKSSDGKALASGNVRAEMSTGEIKTIPFSFAAPKVQARTDYVLDLKTVQDGQPVEGDSFAVTVFPGAKTLKMKSKIAIYDPQGKSAPWLKILGVDATVLKNGIVPDGFDLLIVGREAISPCEDLPYTSEQIRKGLKVLVLEQLPAAMQGLGFRTNETMPRQIFPSGPNCPVLEGLAISDLSYWRGTPDLLPEGVNQPSETRHAPKWTNTHAIASCIPQTPRAVGFAPLLSAEFDLDYSPLLEWRCGKGMILFSSLDFTGRINADPCATLLAGNILTYLDSTVPEERRNVVYTGGAETSAILTKIGVAPAQFTGKEVPKETLLVVGSMDGKSKKEMEEFESKGGRIFFLPQTSATLSDFGLKTNKSKLQRIAPEPNQLFGKIGPNILRWREPVEIDAFTKNGQPAGTSVLAEGLVAQKTDGKGVMVFCQISPVSLPSSQSGDNGKKEAVDVSTTRLEQLLARLLGNMGANPSGKIANRVSFCMDNGSQFVPLKNWSVLGPYKLDSDDGEKMLNTKFSAEEMAIAGDNNPNITFPTPEGKILDWRPTMNPDKNGFVNLGSAYRLESKAVAYAINLVDSATDREAILRIGCDWRMIIWVNGKEVFRTVNGKNMSNAYQVKVALKKGENKISFKIGSGSKGMGFFADISREIKKSNVQPPPELKKVSFYADRPIEDEFDPYFFTYW